MTTDDSVSGRPELRPSVPPTEPGAGADDAPAGEPTPNSPKSAPDTEPELPDSLQWRVPGGLALLKAAGTAGFLVAGLLFARDAAGLTVALVATVILGLYALRDLLAPVRLAADGDGITVVAGYAARRRIPWRDVERIRVDERTRLGLRTALLEIDAGSSLHLFGSSELGAPVEDAAEQLRHFRTGR